MIALELQTLRDDWVAAPEVVVSEEIVGKVIFTSIVHSKQQQHRLY